MAKYFLMIIAVVCLFFGLCCKKEPCITCPQPDTDTTSHNFVWQKYLLGDGSGGSCLYDVAIINDTLAYAVGQIYRNDTTFYAAKWDGKQWELIRIWFYTICGQESRSAYPASSIIAFSDKDIWIAMDGDQVAQWDGKTQTATMCLPVSFSVKKLWGENPNSVYAVGYDGTNGMIFHYANGTWTKIESGTSLSINDIYGAYNSATKQWEILAIASSTQTTENKLLKIQPNNTVVSLDITGLSSFSNGIWFVPQNKYYIVGSGIHQKSLLSDPNWNAYASGEVTSYHSVGIYGQGLNDIFVAGSYFEVVHYNGSTWYNYRNEISLSGNGVLGGIALKGNIVMIVGYMNQYAAVMIGKR